MPGPANPRGHPTTGGKNFPAGRSKEFLKEFFGPDYGGKPKTCDRKPGSKKKTQCGLPGLARGEGNWPTVDPSSAPSGGPSGGSGGGGSGGGGVGASAAASKETNMSTRFRKEMSFGERVAAPPKELGSNPEEMRKQFSQGEETEPSTAEPVEVDPSEISEVAGPSGEPSRSSVGEGDMGGGDMGGGDASGLAMADGDSPETAVEVSGEEVSADEPGDAGEEGRAEEASMTFRSGKDDPSQVHELSPEEEAEVEEVSEEGAPMAAPEPSCGCPAAGGEPEGGAPEGVEIEEVEPSQVTFLEDEPAAEPSRAGKGSYACGPSGKSAEPSGAPSKGPSGEPSEEPSKKEAAAEEVASELVEVLTPIESLGEVKIEDVELNLFGEHSENPHYTVMVQGEPVAKIALADQKLPAGHEDMFLQDEYPQAVLEGIEQFGLKSTLASVNARYYAAKAFEGAVATQMKATAAAEMADAAKRHIAKIKDDLSNVANLVIEASLKNYITENPLRDALVQQMRRAGVDTDAAVDMVEEAFREAGSKYFTAVLNKAEEWMGAPKEAMEHHVKEITGMSYRHPGYAVAETEEIQDVVVPDETPVVTASVPRNIPVRTVAPPTAPAQPRTAATAPAGNWQADKEYWKSQINLFGKTASKSLAAKPDLAGRIGKTK